MYRVTCDHCGDEVAGLKAMRVYEYGKTGITISPGAHVSKVSMEDMHFCSGECLIAHFDWIPKKKP
jgi:hypothetical protein